MGFGWFGEMFGFALPKGMGLNDLAIVGIIAGTGCTVALFVAGEAFEEPAIRDAANMGAMLGICAAAQGIIPARPFGIRKRKT